MLIVVGLILGYALSQIHVSESLFTLKPDVFFLYLLPPIIFDAGQSSPFRSPCAKRHCLRILHAKPAAIRESRLGHAVCRRWHYLQHSRNWYARRISVFEAILFAGGTLFLLGQYGMFSIPFSAFEIMLFSSLISAVDPVAVIAVFEEIHVNEFLFINVFGEALFNDGVTVCLSLDLHVQLARSGYLLNHLFRSCCT